mgnify:CR=1 FL=1
MGEPAPEIVIEGGASSEDISTLDRLQHQVNVEPGFLSETLSGLNIEEQIETIRDLRPLNIVSRECTGIDHNDCPLGYVSNTISLRYPYEYTDKDACQGGDPSPKSCLNLANGGFVFFMVNCKTFSSEQRLSKYSCISGHYCCRNCLAQ